MFCDFFLKNGTFATVAYILCASCAYRRSGQVTSLGRSYYSDQKNYGSGSGPVWLYNLQCTGSELSIADCRHDGWGVTRSCSSRDVAIICSNGTFGSCSKPLWQK